MVAAEIQPLYRSFLKVVQRWPTDKVRPNRDLKQVLITRIEESFKKQEGLSIEKAERELKSLESLLENEFKEKYPLSERILSPASNPTYYSSLVSSIGNNKDQSKGLLSKLLG
ncbi:Ubiquinol-cytochrome-c reductase complex assembly factor 2 [Choanephora cucurbitarum]|uniref:Ubiquinol-cytochrome-c reductase complex assembly factor 2 n=1 Tax=Choanephora cucurbitarum TaxID=101091 RepID=A0A1C7NVJ2_9FUNG|nr:Ubiquinol-cytochrome-c reductase complex assembly factor 2 [Choanephora cucurbitarum]